MAQQHGSSRVFLVRHGETEWSVNGRHTGRTDIPLTEAGRRWAKLLGDRLAGHDFALVLSSPLQRALDTARLAGLGAAAGSDVGAAAGAGTPALELTDNLMEWDYGDYEGRRTVDIRAERPGWLVWTDGVPNGESPADVARRADRVVERARAADGDVALVAHGHMLRVLAARWLGQPPAFGGHLRLATAALSILGWEREWPAIELWNDQSHLS